MPNIAAQTDREAVPKTGSQEASPRISSQQLLGQRREVVILHNGREYRLRQTQNGKLILTA